MILTATFTPNASSQAPITHLTSGITREQWGRMMRAIEIDYPKKTHIGHLELRCDDDGYICQPSRSIALVQWDAIKDILGVGSPSIGGRGGASSQYGGGGVGYQDCVTIHGNGDGTFSTSLTGRIITPEHTATLQEIRDILTDPKFNSMRCQDAVRVIDKALKS